MRLRKNKFRYRCQKLQIAADEFRRVKGLYRLQGIYIDEPCRSDYYLKHYIQIVGFRRSHLKNTGIKMGRM